MSAPLNVTVSDGGVARLHCDVDGFPDNISVDWINDDSVVASTWHETVARQRYVLDVGTASLTVINVSTEDAGMYTCSAYNGLGALATASAYLTVTCEQAHHLVT